MTYLRGSIAATAVSLAIGALAASSATANIVADPSFEAIGNSNCVGSAMCSPLLPAWTFINAASGTDYGVQNFDPHSGFDAAAFAGFTAGSYDVIQQTLTTTSGEFYSLSFWLDTHFNHSNADFRVFWNGVMIYDDPAGTDAAHQFNYTQFNIGSLQATGASTVLAFAGYNVPVFDVFDDIVVTANVPEPATLALLGLGLAGFRFSRRKQ